MMRRIFGMRIKDQLLHFGLFIAVVVSLVFSAIIWIDPITFHRNTTQTTTTNDSGNSADNTSRSNLADVYLPTGVAVTQNKQQFELTSSQDNLIGEMMKNLRQIQIERISSYDDKGLSDYQKSLSGNGNLIFSYASPVPIGLFKEMIVHPKTANRYAHKRFRYIILPANNRYEIDLVNDTSDKVYKLILSKPIHKKVYQQGMTAHVQRTPIQYQELSKGHFIKTYPNGLTVPKYSYLINKENPSLFVSHLLGESSSNSIGTKEQGGVTTYTTDNGQRLVIDSKNGTVNYTRDGRYRQHVVNFGDALKNGFDNLSRLGVSLNDVRFQEYDEHGHQLIYRNYVNGYPIISPNFDGAYRISIQSNGIVEDRFSVNDLQVPLPNNNERVNLPPTSQLIKTLKDSHYNLDKVKTIIVGYQWSPNTSSPMVVDLTPTYFIQYNDNWINYQILQHNH